MTEVLLYYLFIVFFEDSFYLYVRQPAFLTESYSW